MAIATDPTVEQPPQPPPERRLEPTVRRGSRRGARWEGLAIFVLFAGAYFALGYRTTIEDDVIVFDSLDRLARAYMAFWNDPPKLAAIGFAFPPLTTIAFLPLAIVKPLASSLVALPLLSALFSAGTMVVLNVTFRRCEMPALMRYALLLAFGLNPLWLFYAGNGTGDAVYLFFLAFGVMCFVNWYCTEGAIHLMGAGTALALAAMTRYGLLVWAVVTAFLVAAALARRGADRDEVEGSVITYAAPAFYAVALWTLFNALIVDSPFGWLKPSDSTLAVNSDQFVGNGDTDFGNVMEHMLEVVAGVAPLAFLMIVLLVAAFLLKRDDLALWLAGLIALSMVLVVGAAVIDGDLSKIALRAGLPVALTALFGAAWLYRAANGLRLGVFAVTLAFLLLALPLTWTQMKDYPFQNQEQAFTRALFGSEDQAGTSSRGGFTVGIEEERAMAARIKRLVGEDENAVLTDNAQTYSVILLTGRPQIFFDRVDEGDDGWAEALASPEGEVRYMLIAARTPTDLIRERYPEAADGTSMRFTPVYATRRYLLVRVRPSRPATRRGAGAGAGRGPTQTDTPTQAPERPPTSTTPSTP